MHEIADPSRASSTASGAAAEKYCPTPQKGLPNVRYFCFILAVNLLKKLWTPVAPVAPAPAATDPVADALREFQIADREYKSACDALSYFYSSHPEHVPLKRVGNDVWFTVKPEDPALRALTNRENRARHNRAVKMQRWSDLKEQHASQESKHVAGVRM